MTVKMATQRLTFYLLKSHLPAMGLDVLHEPLRVVFFSGGEAETALRVITIRAENL